jgi:hypothetical protein
MMSPHVRPVSSNKHLDVCLEKWVIPSGIPGEGKTMRYMRCRRFMAEGNRYEAVFSQRRMGVAVGRGYRLFLGERWINLVAWRF